MDTDSSLEKLAEELVQFLKEKDMRIVLAESCTGGLLAKVLTDIPGASGAFLGGVVAYSDEAKEEILAVSRRDVVEFGVVSQRVVEEMAKGARKLFHADAALAITGVAGPGPSRGVEQGVIWIALSLSSGVMARRYVFEGARSEVRLHAAKTALRLALENILGQNI